MKIICKNTPGELKKALDKFGVYEGDCEWFAGYDYTDLLVYIKTLPHDKLNSVPGLGTHQKAHREDIQLGPIQELDPGTGRIVVGLEEGSDVEMWPDEYATKEEIAKYKNEWRINISAMNRILEEDGYDIEIDEEDGQYIIQTTTQYPTA